jgi:hypothetical protein
LHELIYKVKFAYVGMKTMFFIANLLYRINRDLECKQNLKNISKVMNRIIHIRIIKLGFSVNNFFFQSYRGVNLFRNFKIEVWIISNYYYNELLNKWLILIVFSIHPIENYCDKYT